MAWGLDTRQGSSRERVHARSWRLIACLLLVHSGLLAYSAYVHSPTLNEPAHLAAGVHHWRFGGFGLYRVNPPLVRMVASVPVLAAGVKADWRGLPRRPGERADFLVGSDLVAANGERSCFLFMIARWACIPFAWIGGIVCYLWARDLYGERAGLMATALWCFSPNILAHGALITPDMPATALFVAACYSFWRWLRRPAWEQVILAGIVLGVAQLTKTTLVVLYAFMPLFWIFCRLVNRAKMCPHLWLREGAMLAACLAISISVINLGYGLEGSFTRLGELPFVSRLFTGGEPGVVGNRFAGTSLGNLPVPLPGDYVRGIDVQRRDFERLGRPSYLGGEFKDTGWWYYYLYALAVKVPLGLWGLLLMASVFRLTRHSGAMRTCPLGDELALLLPAALILATVSSQVGFSEHLRYALPAAPLVFVWLSQIASVRGVPLSSVGAVTADAAWLFRHTVLVGSLLVWALGSSLWVFPHSISYFNELAGGPVGGHAHLLGSNADWGQDIRYLKWWLDEHPEVDSLRLAYCGHCDPRDLGLTFSAPRLAEKNGILNLQPGWYAISVNFLRGYPWFAPDGHGGHTVYGRNALSDFLDLRPVALAGTSIYIFRI